MYKSVAQILERRPISASAPCRVDAGGTWDIKALALPMERFEPVTVNIALNLRTRVSLDPHRAGWVRISSQGFPRGEDRALEGLPFQPPYGLFFAAVAHFGFHGLKIHIQSGAPVKASLGGSSTALMALIKALSRVAGALGRPELSPRDALHLGYHLEDAVNGGNCGIQDQAAAVFGGVSRWTWRFGRRGSPFRREALLKAAGRRELSRRILVAYSGKGHVSSRINRAWIKGFLSGETRTGWMEANEAVRALGRAIEARDWPRAADCLRAETAIRKKITPEALIPVTERLIHQAGACGCGARFAGAGGGGCAWALGEPEDIARLRGLWNETLARVKGARILACAVDARGAG